MVSVGGVRWMHLYFFQAFEDVKIFVFGVAFVSSESAFFDKECRGKATFTVTSRDDASRGVVIFGIVRWRTVGVASAFEHELVVDGFDEDPRVKREKHEG